MHGHDFCSALVFALREVSFLAISMHSWRESKLAWLKVVRGLENLREVVFVREFWGNALCAGKYHLLELGQMDVAVYEFSGDLWSMRILADIKAKKEVWPEWKVPTVEFKAISEEL